MPKYPPPPRPDRNKLTIIHDLTFLAGYLYPGDLSLDPDLYLSLDLDLYRSLDPDLYLSLEPDLNRSPEPDLNLSGSVFLYQRSINTDLI